MPSLFQGYVLLALFYYGLIYGLIYEIKKVFQKIFQNFKIFTFLSDIIFSFLGVIIFFYALLKANLGIFRLFLLIIFVLGFIIEQESVGFFVAKITNMVYNKCILKSEKVKSYEKDKKN